MSADMQIFVGGDTCGINLKIKKLTGKIKLLKIRIFRFAVKVSRQRIRTQTCYFNSFFFLSSTKISRNSNRQVVSRRPTSYFPCILLQQNRHCHVHRERGKEEQGQGQGGRQRNIRHFCFKIGQNIGDYTKSDPSRVVPACYNTAGKPFR